MTQPKEGQEIIDRQLWDDTRFHGKLVVLLPQSFTGVGQTIESRLFYVRFHQGRSITGHFIHNPILGSNGPGASMDVSSVSRLADVHEAAFARHVQGVLLFGPETKGRSYTLDKCGNEEPIFVLRAQDVSAPAVILDWLNRNPQVVGYKYTAAIQSARAMQLWPKRRDAD
jgi:hypothetical protein